MRHNSACQKQSGVSQSVLMGTLRGQFPNNPALKTHLLCMGVRMGYMDGNGNFRENAIRRDLSSRFPPAKVDRLVRTCLIRRNSPEQSAYESIRCISTNA
ncbi:uncharacterized protein LOC132704093 [Cylas formicarius]|uniref:uncharacterized protein LOC132704093 n=1 Tax=Cylas formicarius TaxID=197179 RepID=UPI0029584AAE|nr:uncharacterized protein LOC132704093 [Cylas formicarius]